MEAYISAFVALVGLIIYLLVKSNAEAKEIGRIMFAFGLLVFLLHIGSATIGFK